MSALVAASPELKRLWIRALKRVHPDLAVNEQDRIRCERLTQQANDAFARRDEVALRAVLERKDPPQPPPPHAGEAGTPGKRAAPLQAIYAPPLMPQRPPTVLGREALVMVWAACAVLCLLIYGIFAALSEEVGRYPSLFLLVLLTAALLWRITQSSHGRYERKARWVATVATGMVLVGICLLNSHPGPNPLIPSARAATAEARPDAGQWRNNNLPPLSASHAKQLTSMNAHLPQANPQQSRTIAIHPGAGRIKRPGSQLDEYIEAAKNKVAQKWNLSEVTDGTPAGATVYIQFAIRRRGNHQVPSMQSSSGHSTLDASCLHAVDRVRTFDHLPGSYNGDSLIVLYHCTYPGSPNTRFAQDSILPPAQQPPNDSLVDDVHGAQQSPMIP